MACVLVHVQYQGGDLAVAQQLAGLKAALATDQCIGERRFIGRCLTNANGAFEPHRFDASSDATVDALVSDTRIGDMDVGNGDHLNACAFVRHAASSNAARPAKAKNSSSVSMR